MIVQNQPKGLLGLLLASGGDYPSQIEEFIQPTLDVTEFLRQSICQYRTETQPSTPGLQNQAVNANLGVVPDGHVRWIRRACVEFNASGGTGGLMVLGPWYTNSVITYRTLGVVAHDPISWIIPLAGHSHYPYSALENVFLRSGEELFIWISTAAALTGDVVFSAEFVDLKV